MIDVFRQRLATLSERGYEPGAYRALHQLKSEIEASVSLHLAVPSESDVAKYGLIVSALTAPRIELPGDKPPESLTRIARITEGRVWSCVLINSVKVAAASALADADENVSRVRAARQRLTELEAKAKIVGALVRLLDTLSAPFDRNNANRQ